jgi:hypothetical protein
MAKTRKQAAAATSAPLTPEQDGALAALRAAWIAEQDADAAHIASLSAQTVRRFIEARKKGLSRLQIAAGLNTTSGALSRHVLVSRKADEAVTVDGREYAGTVAALESGTVSLSRLYILLQPTNGSKVKGGKPKQSLSEAVEALCKRPIKYRNGKRILTLKMLESRADLVAGIGALLARPLMSLTVNSQEAILSMIAKPEVTTETADAPAADDERPAARAA